MKIFSNITLPNINLPKFQCCCGSCGTGNNNVQAAKATQPAQIQPTQPVAPRGPITIKNYHHVDNILTRGAKPTKSQISELKRHGYGTVISFCTNFNLHHPTAALKTPEEAEWCKKAGIKFYWLPFSSKENPPESYIKKFFEITDNAKLNNERVFMHCRHGADRTGAFAAMYKIRNYNISAAEAITEMFKYGHDANGNKNLIPFIASYKEKNSLAGIHVEGMVKRAAIELQKLATKLLKSIK